MPMLKSMASGVRNAGQHDQRQADAIDADLVGGIDLREPHHAFHELEAALRLVVAEAQRRATSASGIRLKAIEPQRMVCFWLDGVISTSAMPISGRKVMMLRMFEFNTFIVVFVLAIGDSEVCEHRDHGITQSRITRCNSHPHWKKNRKNTRIASAMMRPESR